MKVVQTTYVITINVTHSRSAQDVDQLIEHAFEACKAAVELLDNSPDMSMVERRDSTIRYGKSW